MKIIAKYILAIAIMTLGYAALPAFAAGSAPTVVQVSGTSSSVDCSATSGDTSSCSSSKSLLGFVDNIINGLLVVAVVSAVIMIVIAGFSMVVSGGDAKAVESARNRIIYAIVGLVIAVLAKVIVIFVVNKLK